MADNQKSSLDFMPALLNVELNKNATAQQLEREAQAVVDINNDVTGERAAVESKIIQQSNTLAQTQAQIVDTNSGIASIAGDMDAAIKMQRKGIESAAGLEVTTANVAKQVAAPAAETYLEEANNPVVDSNIKRYKQEVDAYSANLIKLQSDTSFLGQLKRATLEGVTRKRLNESRANLQAARGRKQASTATFLSSLQGANAFAQHSSSVERQVIAQSMVKAESAIKLLQSKLTVEEADKQTLGSQLQLDKANLDTFIKEYSFLKDRGLTTTANVSALQTQIYAQQVQTTALKGAKDAQNRIEVAEAWEAYVDDSALTDAQKVELKATHTDPYAKEFTDSSQGKMFWALRGIVGTKNEFALGAMSKKANNIELTESEMVAVKLVKQGTDLARQQIITQFDAKVQNDRKNSEQYEAERDAALESLSNPAEQAKFYQQALATMKSDASKGIQSGAIVMPDINAAMSHPDFTLGANVSESFKAILTDEKFATIPLGMQPGVDVGMQYQNTMNGVVDFIYSAGTQDNLGRIQLDGKTREVIDTVAKGLGDYYSVVRKYNNQSARGIGSDILPALKLPTLGPNGTTLDLGNASQWEQALLLHLRKRSNLGNLSDILPSFSDSSVASGSAASHIRGIN